MRASEFITQVETKHGVSFAVCPDAEHSLGGEDSADNLVGVVGFHTLPNYLKLAIAGHQTQLTRFLVDGHDDQLRFSQCAADLRRLGLVQLDNGRWSHPDGDHVMDALLAGLLDPDKAAQDAIAREQQARHEVHAITGHNSARLPAPVDATDLKEVSPGRFTWTEEKGANVRDPFPRVPRI